MKEEKLGLKALTKLSQRTFKSLGKVTITPLVGTPYTVDLDFDHMVSGISSELAGEFPLAVEKDDVINQGEELFDAEWYITNLARIKGIELKDEYRPQVNPKIDHLTNFIVIPGELIDMHKRALAYGSKYPTKAVIKHKLELLLQGIQFIADKQGIDLPAMRARGIAKLYKRYPDGFSSDKALLRDLGVERLALEGK